MNEVVTDQEHHSVKDLVAMIEKNTVTESANPYVRKWGCDLISPEPHTRNVTYRREKRDYPRLQPKKTHNWAQQNEQKNRFDHNGNDQARGGLDNDFRLSSHVTEIDDLLGRAPTEYMMTFDNLKEKKVAWPPPLHKSDSTDTRNTADFDRQSSFSTFASQSQKDKESSKKMAKKAMDDLDIQIEQMQDTFDKQINSMKNTYNMNPTKPAVKGKLT